MAHSVGMVADHITAHTDDSTEVVAGFRRVDFNGWLPNVMPDYCPSITAEQIGCYVEQEQEQEQEREVE